MDWRCTEELDSATDGDDLARNERVPTSPADTTDDEDGEDDGTEEEREEDLGRGARSRAKASPFGHCY